MEITNAVSYSFQFQIIALLRPSICLQPSQPNTPLMVAASFGHITTQRLLLDRGAEVDRKGEVRIEHVSF